jgi:hypothetical protein
VIVNLMSTHDRVAAHLVGRERELRLRLAGWRADLDLVHPDHMTEPCARKRSVLVNNEAAPNSATSSDALLCFV